MNIIDKFEKVRKLYDIICQMEIICNKVLQQFVDEQMVSYTGKNSSNQTIRTKRIRFGCKQFVLTSNDAYPYFLDHYCRAKYGEVKLPKNLCALSVLDSVTKISKWSDKKVYFDNWFSSMSLLQVLKAESLHATGTIGADRLGNDLKISKKDI